MISSRAKSKACLSVSRACGRACIRRRGFAPAVVAELFEQFTRLRDEGMTLLIVDQMADYALAIADRGYLLGGGRIVAQGSPSELRGAMLDDAYLGSASWSD